MKNRKTGKILTFISMMLFPLSFNFFSPYVSIDGAMAGIISGSMIVFGVMFVSGIFWRRAWCSYVCPWSMPSEWLRKMNNRPVNIKKTQRVRYMIFAIWSSVIIVSFVMAGGIHGIDPLHLTERYVSIDEPLKFVTYYMVVLILTVVTLAVGRRGACHSICWMSPFLELGSYVGSKLRIPQWKIRSKPELCIECQKCNKTCPMSIDVMESLKNLAIDDSACILCGDCVEACPRHVLTIG
jgi:polyferredoxin